MSDFTSSKQEHLSAVALVTICCSDEAGTASSQSRFALVMIRWFRSKLDLHSITYNSCHFLLSSFKERKKREEEKAAVRAASLGHLNFLGQTLTTYGSQIPNLVAKRDNVLGEQKNQEKGEDTAHDKDFERASATNESSVIIWEEISLTEQVRVNKDEVLSGSSDASARPVSEDNDLNTSSYFPVFQSSTKRQRDDNGEDREEQTSAEVDEEPEMINEMDYVPYIVDGIEIVAKLLEQKAVAAFYDILDLSEERGSDSIKSRFSPTVWKKLRSAARMEMVKMNDEVKAWLVAFDDKVSRMASFSATLLVTRFGRQSSESSFFYYYSLYLGLVCCTC
ncbi:hypothetical protein BC938DRAFT_470716, partial [Jimgerdemannia flammicorona]